MNRTTQDHADDRSGAAHAPERYPRDRQLALRAAQGDEPSIRAMGARLACVPKLLRAANQRRTNPLSDSEIDDVTQDTLLQLWQKIGTYTGSASLETWAWSFGVLQLKNRMRANMFRRSVEGTNLDAVEREPASRTYEEPRFSPDNVRAAINRMPQELAEIIRLKHDAGQKFREIAVTLAISENTAKSRYYRGIGLLRDQLARQAAHRAI